MKFITVDTYEKLSRQAANIISAQVILKPDSVLGLATGSSPLGTYKQLIEWYKKGDIDFSKVKLYVYREHKNGVKALARPCPACQKMIKDMGIKEVWFTTENGFGYEWMED